MQKKPYSKQSKSRPMQNKPGGSRKSPSRSSEERPSSKKPYSRSTQDKPVGRKTTSRSVQDKPSRDSKSRNLYDKPPVQHGKPQNKPQGKTPSKAKEKKYQPLDESGTKKIRLNKIIADSGLCSRRKADALITEGKVHVNGKLIKELGQQFYPQSAKILVEGKPLPMARNMDIIFYKPKGLLTSKKDDKNRKTIYDSLPPEFKHLDPAGRLDKETSGLLILSSDGQFIHQITHPSFHINKVYQVSLNKVLTEKDIKQLITGVVIPKASNPEVTTVAQVEWIETFPESHTPHSYKVCLKTGINRQIRKSFESLGYEVLKLKRISFGNITLGRLKPGQFKTMRPFEKKILLSGK